MKLSEGRFSHQRGPIVIPVPFIGFIYECLMEASDYVVSDCRYRPINPQEF